MNDNKPNLYRGQIVPLYQLSADAFEDFTYQVLNVIGKRKGFNILSGRQTAADGPEDKECIFSITNINYQTPFTLA